MKALIAAIALCLCVSVSCDRPEPPSTSEPVAPEPGIGLYRGELEGSKILIVSPGNWNKKLLILAHGHRAEKEDLHADFPYESMFFRTLLAEGWIVASTSYRRNGIIIEDAITDLNYLREFVIDKYGRPERTYMKGSSMGGIICLLIAENHPDRTDGILDECAPVPKELEVTHSPRVPMMFFTNQDEAPPVREYVSALAENAIKPGLWVVKREGHCNFNDEETLEAFRGMVALSENRPIEYSREFVVEKPERTSVAIFRDDRAYAKVTGFSPTYGNIYTEFVRSDLDRLGVEKGGMFAVGYLDKEYPIKLGSDYRDVPRGDWVAFFDARADNLLKISRSFANARDQLGCTRGVRIYLKR